MRCLPLALLAALAACTPDAPRIQQVDAPADSRDPVGPYALVASIDGKTDVIVVSWLADDVPGPTLGMSRRGDGRYEARLPGQPPGTTVRLRVLVDGPGGEDEWPGDGEYHEFRVLAADGACLFKVYLGRDAERRLIPDQIAAFDRLEARLMDDPL